MKKFKIVESPTVIHGRTLPFGAIYGTISCEFRDTYTKRIQHKNGNTEFIDIGTHTADPVTYYIQVHTPHFKGNKLFYELWIWFPTFHTWEYTRVYHHEFEPIYNYVYDTINRHQLRLKPCTNMVNGESTPGAPRTKKAQEEYNYRTRMMARVLGGIHDESCINNDTNVTPRSFVHNTGFKDKSRKESQRTAYAHSTPQQRKAINRNIVIATTK